jgi:hypothetical protein
MDHGLSTATSVRSSQRPTQRVVNQSALLYFYRCQMAGTATTTTTTAPMSPVRRSARVGHGSPVSRKHARVSESSSGPESPTPQS